MEKRPHHHHVRTHPYSASKRQTVYLETALRALRPLHSLSWSALHYRESETATRTLMQPTSPAACLGSWIKTMEASVKALCPSVCDSQQREIKMRFSVRNGRPSYASHQHSMFVCLSPAERLPVLLA